jgi:hypothetical protein
MALLAGVGSARAPTFAAFNAIIALAPVQTILPAVQKVQQRHPPHISAYGECEGKHVQEQVRKHPKRIFVAARIGKRGMASVPG